VAAKFETNDGRGHYVSNDIGSSGESIVTRMLNVGIEVFSVVMSFLSCGTLHVHSELPGGENVGRTSFSHAIASIFGNHDASEQLAADRTSPSSGGRSPLGLRKPQADGHG
jgi:hypothetical protein